MLTDLRNTFAQEQSVAGSPGTALVGDVIDLEQVRDLGNGQPVWLVVQATAELVTAGDPGTVQLALVSDAQAAIATDGSATVHLESPTWTTGDAGEQPALAAGKALMVASLPIDDYERFLGVLATVGDEPLVGGAVSAWLALDVPHWLALPEST